MQIYKLFVAIIISILITFTPKISFAKNILLIPLDSRPPCTDFVEDLASISNYKLILPPKKFLDYFTLPGEIDNLRRWLINEVETEEIDAIILSIDQITSGGLIASREKNLSKEDIESLNNFLIDFREKFSNVPIYAFNILPRMNPPASIDNFFQRRALMALSRLIGRSHSGLIVDDESLFEVYSEITPDNLNRYLNIFKMNRQLSERLIDLTNKKIIDKIIFGMDDAEKFSIQNVLVDELKNYSDRNDKIIFTHGADEIALTLIAEIVEKDFNYTPKIFIQYNEVETAKKIMPYMSATIDEVVREKIFQLHGEIVNDQNNADFILFVAVDDTNSVDVIKNLIESQKKIALVDLSTHFTKSEILLPKLIAAEIPINSLIAYSGWNTASNSIGTALSQAIIFQASNENFIENLRFLNQRFIEDYIYLKDVIDGVNIALKKSGSYDTSFLDYGTEYEFATFVMRTLMTKKIFDFKNSNAFKQPIKINNKRIRLKNFSTEMKYFWPRTFEIKLKIDNLICDFD